jgi:hypothetical protein
MSKKEVILESVEDAMKRGVSVVVLEEGEKARKPRKSSKITVTEIWQRCPPEKREMLRKALMAQGVDVSELK